MTDGLVLRESTPPAALGDPLPNVTHEPFAQEYAAHGNATRAYAATHDVPERPERLCAGWHENSRTCRP